MTINIYFIEGNKEITINIFYKKYSILFLSLKSLKKFLIKKFVYDNLNKLLL